MPRNHNVDLLNSAEVCDLLAIDRSTLSRWVKDGRLSCYMKLPGARGAFLFDRANVMELLESKPAAS